MMAAWAMNAIHVKLFFLEGDNGFPIVSADANSGRFE